MAEINLNWGPQTLAAFAVISASPQIAIGVVCGALAWRQRRWLGGALGAALGLALGVAGFEAWADTSISISVDYFEAVRRALLIAAPGAIVWAGLGGWIWREERARGAVLGGLAGGALCLAVWIGVKGGL